MNFNTMQKGDIWWANLPEPIGRRPVALLSRNEAYEVRNSVMVAEVTSTIRNIPVEVRIGKRENMPKECVINLDTIITIRKELLDQRIVHLDSGKISEVDDAIKFALDL
ncbi:MAG: type II toxin-antitoxin system PemK/MazF family toxin [Atribacterota bacterium]|jgi:mRNA interferase MazF|nr:type II toxin-antitoxin system PemK/MazF family toxin [Atribacterota bacterium]